MNARELIEGAVVYPKLNPDFLYDHPFELYGNRSVAFSLGMTPRGGEASGMGKAHEEIWDEKSWGRAMHGRAAVFEKPTIEVFQRDDTTGGKYKRVPLPVPQGPIVSFWATLGQAREYIESAIDLVKRDYPDVFGRFKDSDWYVWTQGWAGPIVQMPVETPRRDIGQETKVELARQRHIARPEVKRALGIKPTPKAGPPLSDRQKSHTSEALIEGVEPDLETKAVMRRQWMRNKEGGQKYGNQEIIVPVDQEVFDRYVRQLCQAQYQSWRAYHRAFPEEHARFVRFDRAGPWQLSRVGDLDRVLRMPMEPRWVIAVDDFNSPEAVRQGSTADSDPG